VTGPENEPCRYQEWAVAWALHALEPDEEQEFRGHLPQCASCRAVVEEADEVLASLGAAVEQVDPPPSLRASLMSAVAQTPQGRQTAAPGPSKSGDEPADEPTGPPVGRRRDHPVATRPSATRSPRDPRRPRRTRRLVAAAMALLGVIAIGGLATRTAQLQQQRDAEVAQAQTLSRLLDQIAQPGARYALLAQDDDAVAAVLVDDGRREVFTLGLPVNQADRDTYVLWGLPASGDPRALGTFDVPAADPGIRTVGPAGGDEEFGQYAISIEPGRVAPPAPSTVVAVGEVTA